MRELQQYGVVAEFVIRPDPPGTAWVKFVDISASAEVGVCAYCLFKFTALELLSHNPLIMQADLIMLGNNNNLQIERCSGPPV